MSIDISRMNIGKIMKKANNALKVANAKAESEAQAERRRHDGWCRGVEFEMHKLYKEMCKDFGFMSNWYLEQFTERMDEMIAPLEVDVNVKNYLRSKFMMDFYHGSFCKNYLTQDQFEEYWELQKDALNAIHKYDIPRLAKVQDTCYGYKFWKDYHAEELERIYRTRESIKTRSENSINDLVEEIKERQDG